MACEIQKSCKECVGDEKCLWLAFRNGTCNCWNKVQEAGSNLLGVVRPGGICSRFQSLFCGSEDEDDGLSTVSIGLIVGASLVVGSAVAAACWYWRWELVFFFRDLRDNPVELWGRIVERCQTKWNQIRDCMRNLHENPGELMGAIVDRFQTTWNQVLELSLFLQDHAAMLCDRVRGWCPEWVNDGVRQVSACVRALGRSVNFGWQSFRAGIRTVLGQAPPAADIYRGGFRQFQFDMDPVDLDQWGDGLDHWDPEQQRGYVPNRDNGRAAAGQEEDQVDDSGDEDLSTSEEEDERRRQEEWEVEVAEQERRAAAGLALERRREELENIVALERAAEAGREQLIADRRAIALEAAERRRQDQDLEVPVVVVPDGEIEARGGIQQLGDDVEEEHPPPHPLEREGLSPQAANVLANAARRPHTRSAGSPGIVPALPPRM